MSRRLFSRALGGRLGALFAVTLALMVAWPAGASAVRTQTRIYSPFTASGKPAFRVAKTVSGDCLSGADSPPRADAWRCETRANLRGVPFLLVSCFSSSRAKDFVLCPESGPWSSAVLKLKLTRRLPVNNGYAPGLNGAWGIETTSGWKCLYFTGARGIIGSQGANYFCPNINDKYWLWGYPARRSEPWTIYYAPPSARRLTQKASIVVAWF